MPTLNVTRVLRQPQFQTTFQVIRASSTPGTDGRPVTVQTTLTFQGVITQGTLEPILLGSEVSVAKRSIRVNTQAVLYDVASGYQPDIVVYDGNNYQVVKVYDWSQYGEGFYQAEAELQDTGIAP